MKHAEYIVENNIIEFLNNPFTGVETLLLNGEKVSDKFSFFGAKHNFNINEEEYNLQVGIDFSKAGGASSYVYKGVTKLDLVNRISKNEKDKLKIKFVLTCVIAGFIGAYLGGYGIGHLLALFN